MPATPVLIPHDEKPAMWAMLQRYIVEMFAIMGQPHNGQDYPFPPFDSYWDEDGNWPFWAMVDRERAGFALISREAGWTRVKEFYITPEFRRGGLGLGFARALLAMHPGQWKIRQMAVNTAAVAFWHGVIGDIAFTEERFVDKGLDRIEQTFVVPAD
jgi:predicted acetyltransferase